MDVKKTAVLLSRKLTLYTVVLVPPGGKFKNFHLFSHFSASRGIKSKTVQAAEIRIKFCIFSGQIHVSPCPEHKLSILRHQMKMAVFFGSIWARLAFDIFIHFTTLFVKICRVITHTLKYYLQ